MQRYRRSPLRNQSLQLTSPQPPQLAHRHGALSSLSASQQALKTGQNALDQGVTGAQPEDVAASQAALKQAQVPGLCARQSRKSIIRAPISGTINSFSLKVGDYVSPTQEVLTVANNGASRYLRT